MKMQNNDKKQSLIVKIARSAGERSVGRCGVWFNQPKVPAELLRQQAEKEDK